MTRKLLCLMLFALVSICSTDGCGAPERKVAADQLTQTIRQMPGVRDVTVNSTNDFEQGSTVNIYVFLPDAPRKLIEAVVTRINAVRGDAFAKYDQTAEFAVTPSRTVVVKRGAELDPHSVGTDADGLRKVSSAAGAAEATIFRNKSTATVDIRKASQPDNNVFAAVRAGFGDDAHLDLNLLPLGDDRPSWRVAFPFGIADEQRVDQQLAAMPVEVYNVTVGPRGTIDALGVSVSNRDTAYRDLVSTIGTVGAGTAHPLDIRWRLAGASGPQKFSGSVDVGSCHYVSNSEGESHPEKYLTPDALALQQRMRKQFDTCPK